MFHAMRSAMLCSSVEHVRQLPRLGMPSRRPAGRMTMKAFNYSTPVAYSPTRKHLFKNNAKRALRRLAEALALPAGSYDLRWNEGGIAVSGEATLHHEKIYVQVMQSCLGSGHGILIRSCKGRRDYTGGRNHWLPLDRLHDIDALARHVRNVLWDSIWMETPAEYRSLIDGQRYILELVEGRGTCLVSLETSNKASLG